MTPIIPPVWLNSLRCVGRGPAPAIRRFITGALSVAPRFLPDGQVLSARGACLLYTLSCEPRHTATTSGLAKRTGMNNGAVWAACDDLRCKGLAVTDRGDNTFARLTDRARELVAACP